MSNLTNLRHDHTDIFNLSEVYIVTSNEQVTIFQDRKRHVSSYFIPLI
jgi:hypothetical protein